MAEEKRVDFLTTKQLATVLQVSESTIQRMRRAGRIPSIRLSDRIVRFSLKEVRQALKHARLEQSEAESVADDGQMSFLDVCEGFAAGEEPE
jgi:excisionase family DNA binding protein